jgi:hypothetical protein
MLDYKKNCILTHTVFCNGPVKFLSNPHYDSPVSLINFRTQISTYRFPKFGDQSDFIHLFLAIYWCVPLSGFPLGTGKRGYG